MFNPIRTFSFDKATLFIFTEQGIIQKIVAESGAEHFAAESESVFWDAGFSQKIQGRFP
jgi:hypothetical protein